MTGWKLQKETHLSIAVVVDEIAPRQNEPTLFVIDGGETFLVLRTFHHEPLPNHVPAFWLHLPIFPRHTRWRATLEEQRLDYYIVKI